MTSKSSEPPKTACEIGGVDPSIIQELSGIYKPFPKAFKELVSNAYDADAELVRINVTDDLTNLEILDDGCGMTPFEFLGEFTKLGGSHKRTRGAATPKGRLKIGSKGIGFLAVARYCSSMEIVSGTLRKHRGKILHKGGATSIDLVPLLGIPIQRQLVQGRLRVTSVTLLIGTRSLLLKPTDFELSPTGRVRIIKNTERARMSNSIEVRYCLNCCDLEFKARIDYDYLLSLENKEDLAHIPDFCEIEVYALDRNDPRVKRQYTNITLQRLKDFIVRDLGAPKRPGRVRNVESESGVERFVWHLSRCIPIQYQMPKPIQEVFATNHLEANELKSIGSVVVSLKGQELELRRPVWGGNHGREWTPSDDVSVVVRIDEGGLRAQGYIWGHREAIFPAEYRGVAIRVRNVQIGPPGFLGLEQKLTGAARGLLSQITGEINIVEGLDASDALNPGRDSFYEENQHYKILSRHLVGSGETNVGLLGELISRMLERLQVLSAVEANLSKASNYRSTLLNLSLAINYYGSNSNSGIDLKRLFADSLRANGLSEREDFDVLPGPRVAGFHVKGQSNLEQEQLVDYDGKTVYFNFQQDRWSNKIFVLGHHYDVVRKIGNNTDPLCEIDTAEKKVYVNWGHSLRPQMGDVSFLKSAIAWKLSYHACQGNIETMMDLALNLLSFNGV